MFRHALDQLRSRRRTITAIRASEPARAIKRAIVMGAETMGADSAALLFVYGSLMRGQASHNRMAGCRWQGQAELTGLALHDLGPFPMAVPSEDPSLRLHGELYAVNDEQLAALDHFEGVPRLYERQRRTLADGRAVWIYVGRPRQVRHVAVMTSGRWCGRSSQGDCSGQGGD